jgi:hypothetical protein
MPGWPVMGPAAEPLPGPRLALVVATGVYTADPGLRRLRAPARDADDLAQVLADPGIGGFAVTTVIDQPAQQVRLAIEDFLVDRGTGDLLLVYLSCHGLLDARRRLYFAATDTHKDRLGSTGVEAAWVLDQLEHCRARRQVLILDSCFSGAFAHGAKGEADLGLRDRFVGQGRGRVVLTASTATEYSFEGDPTDAATPAGSVFTAVLVQGLRTGAADADHDGHVSVDDAYTYVFDQVQAAGAEQTPQRWLYGAEGRILLARNPAGPTVIPAPLPESLRAGLESPHPGIRIGAVNELGEWLNGGDPARVATALRHLQEVAENDIPRVAATARTLLGTRTTADSSAPAVAPAPPLVPPSDLPRERIEDAARNAAEAQGRRWSPEGLARAKDTVAQLRTTIAQLEKQLARAHDRGDASAERVAEEALTARRAWLEEAEHTLAEFTQEDPWHQFARTNRVGQVVRVRVMEVFESGAFVVRVDEGIEGLVHRSELANQHVEPAAVVRVGAMIIVKIIGIDVDRRRISLSLKHANEGTLCGGAPDEFDPTLYGMQASYHEQGNYEYPEGFDPEAGEWLPGYEKQREEWEHQYAEAQARFEAHQRQVEESRWAAGDRAVTSGSTPGTLATGTLASDKALAALREKLSGGQG